MAFRIRFPRNVFPVVYILGCTALGFGAPPSVSEHPALPIAGPAAPAAAAEAQNAVAPTPTPTPAPASPIENAVVKIFSTVRYPDSFKPWTKMAPQEISGTGVIIEGKRILTNSHVVLYASQVQVQANQSGDKISATVEAIAPGIDLAVLKLDDPSFFDAHPALPRASMLPSIKDSVMAYGFPTGGTSLSITKGIVSRIEFSGYNYPVSGLRIQIDAAINPGNSGGPAIVGEKMIGLAYSKLGGAENIGYIIPNEEIDLFLADIADGKFDGKPALFDDLQTLENAALRKFLKLDKSVQGIVVHIPYDSDAAYPLKEWDVITKIGDTPVDDEGMIKLGNNLRVSFRYLVQNVAKDGHVALTVVRAGKPLNVSVPVSPERPQLIPDLRGSYPPYFICGSLVFSVVNSHMAAGIASNGNMIHGLANIGSPIITRRGDKPAFPGEELVVVSSPFFPHKLVKGYSNPFARVLDSINGVQIKNLAHLVTLIRDSHDEYFVFKFSGQGGESLVFNRQELIASTEDILNDNGVRSQGSPDTLALWNKK